jgi:hypothetical protein
VTNEKRIKRDGELLCSLRVSAESMPDGSWLPLGIFDSQDMAFQGNLPTAFVTVRDITQRRLEMVEKVVTRSFR